jgi:Flp pilus assembly protein protease CpaA
MRTLSLCFLMAISLLISLHDLADRRIPNKFSALVLLGAFTDRLLAREAMVFLPAIALFISFSLLSLIAVRPGRFAFGAGDAKLIGTLAFWTGKEAMLTVTTAFILALPPALFFLFGRSRRQNLPDELPFGPFLLLSAWVVRFY